VATRELDAYRRVWRDRLDVAERICAVWVAIDGDDIVGMVSVSRVPEDGEDGQPRAAIRSLHVHPRWIGHGVSRELWSCVRSFLREHGFATATLDTIAENARARRFFEASGCRLARIEPHGVEDVPIAVYELGLAAPGPQGKLRVRPHPEGAAQRPPDEFRHPGDMALPAQTAHREVTPGDSSVLAHERRNRRAGRMGDDGAGAEHQAQTPRMGALPPLEVAAGEQPSSNAPTRSNTVL
jgi:GNAT superfamily N-acetyltransferase